MALVNAPAVPRINFLVALFVVRGCYCYFKMLTARFVPKCCAKMDARRCLSQVMRQVMALSWESVRAHIWEVTL